jgi:hypothetical protein
MTPREAAESIVNKPEADAADAWYPRTFYDDALSDIEKVINAAVEEEREAWIKIATERREAIFDVRKDCDRNTRDYDVYTMQICELDHVIGMIRARGNED